MAVPPLREMIEPLLRVLAACPKGLRAREAQDLLADQLQLSEEDRALRVPGGTQVLFRHRTNWAHDRLKRARLSSSPRKGLWQITLEGTKLLANTTDMSKDALQQIARVARDQKLPTHEVDRVDARDLATA